MPRDIGYMGPRALKNRSPEEVPRDDLYGSESVKEPQSEEEPPETPQDCHDDRPRQSSKLLGGDSLRVSPDDNGSPAFRWFRHWDRRQLFGPCCMRGPTASAESDLAFGAQCPSRHSWARMVHRTCKSHLTNGDHTVEEPAATQMCAKCGEVKLA